MFFLEMFFLSPSTPAFNFFIVFFINLFEKFGKQYEVNVGLPSATLA